MEMDEVKKFIKKEKDYVFTYKIVIIGDAGTGKSSVDSKAIKNIFKKSYFPTLESVFLTFNSEINKKKIKLQICDTRGQENYKSLITSFYNASLCIIVYSLDFYESFIDTKNWLKYLKENSSSRVKIFLVVNKFNLQKERGFLKKKQKNSKARIIWINILIHLLKQEKTSKIILLKQQK